MRRCFHAKSGILTKDFAYYIRCSYWCAIQLSSETRGYVGYGTTAGHVSYDGAWIGIQQFTQYHKRKTFRIDNGARWMNESNAVSIAIECKSKIVSGHCRPGLFERLGCEFAGAVWHSAIKIGKERCYIESEFFQERGGKECAGAVPAVHKKLQGYFRRLQDTEKILHVFIFPIAAFQITFSFCV